MNSGLEAGGSSSGGAVDVNQEEVQWTNRTVLTCPDCLHHMGIEHPLGMEVVPCPHASHIEQPTIYFKHTIMFISFYFRILQKCRMKSLTMTFYKVMMKM